ncbi:MAG: hypothetical protein ACKO9Z_13290, partial [Planctomycetota bacterium]
MGLRNSSGVLDFRNLAASFLAGNRPNLALHAQKHHYLAACGRDDGSRRWRMEVGPSSQPKIGRLGFFQSTHQGLAKILQLIFSLLVVVLYVG